MTLTASNAEAIQELINQDPALADELRGASNTEEFMRTLTAAAHAKGITLDEMALTQTLDTALNQYTEGKELSDEQLESVTGGGLFFTLVLGGLLGAAAAGGVIGGTAGLVTALKK